MDLLIEKGANNLNEVLIEAVNAGWYDDVKLFLERGANNYDAAINFPVLSKSDNYDKIIKLLKEYKNK